MALLAAACARPPELPGGPGPTVELRLPSAVEFGRAFRLEVVRVWPADRPAPAWDPDLLAPLELEPIGVRGGRRQGRRWEQRSFLARSFVRGRLEFGSDPATVLEVRSSLPAEDRGEPEFPVEGPLAPGDSRPAWLRLLGLVGAAAIGLAWLVIRRRSARARHRAPPAAAIGPGTAARLLALASAPAPGDPEEAARRADEIESRLRAWLEERYGLDTRALAGPERGAALRTRLDGPAEAAAVLDRIGGLCDRLRFDRPRAPVPLWRRLREELHRLMEEAA
ncbi:MAG: hypothetical protein D6702_01340 [Planctomycetota bacterium]|nr:MAG: hypothetical protein D6702_01340 [Planctomycetota bacterium]